MAFCIVSTFLFMGGLAVADPMFRSGTGRPSGFDQLVTAPPHSRAAAPIDIEALWNRIQSDVGYQNATGALSPQEREALKTPTSSGALEVKAKTISRFIHTLESDRAAGVTADTSASIKMADSLSGQYDLSTKSLNGVKAQAAKLTHVEPSGADIARGVSPSKFRVGALFGAVGEVAMVAALAKDAAKGNQEVVAEEHIQKNQCGNAGNWSSKAYVNAIVGESFEKQQSMLNACNEDLKHKAAIALKDARELSLKALSTGNAKCIRAESGGGVIETSGDLPATRHVFIFDREGRLEGFRVLPKDKAQNQSFLDYYNFNSGEPRVSYTGIRNKNRQDLPTEFGKPQIDESAKSFSARMFCAQGMNCIDSADGVYRSIDQADWLPAVTPGAPFGNFQPGRDFFLAAGNAARHFRVAIENTGLRNFSEICSALDYASPISGAALRAKDVFVPPPGPGSGTQK